MMRPLALDLFCGAGGAAMGLHRAGFDVIGVDHRPQPRYPFTFVQGDALQPPLDLSRFDFIWASSPCQRYAHISRVNGDTDRHPDLVEPTRAMLKASGRPWCIENVIQAPIRGDIVLDGGMFGANTWRKRKFELSFFALQPPTGKRFGPVTCPGSVSVVGHTGGGYRNRYQGRVRNGTIAKWREAMGIDWMTAKEMAQAIPPAYAAFIGRAALQLLRSAA